MVLTIIGVVLIVVGIIVLLISISFWRDKAQAMKRVAHIKHYETSRIADIVDIYEQLKDGLNGNYRGEVVELSGIICAKQPLIAKHSQTEVIYYQATVVHEYEEISLIKERDSDGNETEKEVAIPYDEIAFSKEEYTKCYLDDGSGAQVLIDLKEGQKHTVRSVDKYQKEGPEDFIPSYGTKGATKRYHYTEEIIPNNTQLYVLGQAIEKNGELVIVKPEKKEKVDFIVSTQSEEELLESTKHTAKDSSEVAVFGGVIGAILILGGIALTLA